VTNRIQARGFQGGAVKSSGVPAGGIEAQHGLRAHGMLLSGVVIASYVQLDGNPALPEGHVQRPTAVYCDVLIYSTRAALRGQVIYAAMVADSVGLHGGHVWIPRAATLNIAGEKTGLPVVDPRDLDGDHVLVQFLDDNLNSPVITSRIPHPQAGLGNEEFPQAGHRVLLKVSDGTVDFRKHQGTFQGVDANGNFLVDSTRAHGGKYTLGGGEDAGKNAIFGNQTFTLPNVAKFTVLGVEDQGKHAPNNEKFRLVLEANKLTVQMMDDPLKSVVLDTDAKTLTVKLGAENKSLVLDENAGSLTVKLGDDNKSLVLNGTSLTVKLGDATHELVLDHSALEAKVGGDGLKLEQFGPSAVLAIGGGGDFAVSFNQLDAWWTVVGPLIASHVHPTTAPGAPTLTSPAIATVGSAPPQALWKLAGLKVRAGNA
jgi:hypothetical protein